MRNERNDRDRMREKRTKEKKVDRKGKKWNVCLIGEQREKKCSLN